MHNLPLRRSLLVAALLLLAGAFASAQGLASLTEPLAANGLKEALGRGVQIAVSETGKPGGFENNPLIKIAMPEKLQFLAKSLRAVGLGSQVDKFEHSMNAAAEEAAPAAAHIFLDAIKKMTFADAKQILAGGDTAGTDYFRRTTSVEICNAFRPIIQKTMASNSVTAKLDALLAASSKLPFASSSNVNIEDYVLQKAVDGLFTMLGEEEKKIRKNPAARVTPLLRKVFGVL